MASPLDFNPSYSHYWIADADALFDLHFNTLSFQFTGFSVCHPIYNKQTMNLSLRHAIYSAILSPEATVLYHGFYVAHEGHQKVGVCLHARTHAHCLPLTTPPSASTAAPPPPSHTIVDIDASRTQCGGCAVCWD